MFTLLTIWLLDPLIAITFALVMWAALTRKPKKLISWAIFGFCMILYMGSIVWIQLGLEYPHDLNNPNNGIVVPFLTSEFGFFLRHVVLLIGVASAFWSPLFKLISDKMKAK